MDIFGLDQRNATTATLLIMMDAPRLATMKLYLSVEMDTLIPVKSVNRQVQILAMRGVK